MLTPEEMQIAELKASGLSQQEIARIDGRDRSVISRNLSKPEVKAYVEKLNRILATKYLARSFANIGYAINKYMKGATIKALTKDGKEIELTDTQLREHGFKASQRVMESVRLFPSHTESYFFQQTNNTENHYHLEEASKAALQHLGIVDITPEVEKKK